LKKSKFLQNKIEKGGIFPLLLKGEEMKITATIILAVIFTATWGKFLTEIIIENFKILLFLFCTRIKRLLLNTYYYNFILSK